MVAGPDDQPCRASAWRELQAMGALKLQPGLWAVAHRDGGCPYLDQLAGRVRAEGAIASIAEVDHVDALDVGLQSRLDRSCERLWDELLNATDWFESQLRVGDLRSSDCAAAFNRLRALYASTLPRDLVGSAAARHAADRLHLLGSTGLDVCDDAAEDRPGPSRHRARVCHRVEVAARWLQRNGDTMLVARVEPLPDPSWEKAFQAFESWAYRPSASRAPLEHGVVRGPVDSDDVEGAVNRISARVASFASTLDPG